MGDSPLYIFKSFGPFWLVQEETFTGHESSSRSASRRSSVHVIDGIDGSNVIDNIAGEEPIIPPDFQSTAALPHIPSDSHSTHSFHIQLVPSTTENIRNYCTTQQETSPADMDLATGNKNDRVGNGMGAPGTFVNLIPVTSSETLHATSSVKSCHGNLNKKHSNSKRRRSSASSYTFYRPIFPNYADGRSRSKHNKKKYKLLILWPLPIITRYIILLSILISMLNWTGFISLKCSAPSFVIHRLEIENLLLSPFLFSLQMSNVLLAASNLLTLGLFEESLTSMLGGPKKFLGTMTSLMLGVCVLRQAIGFIFSRSTGWSIPSLFFSDSLHECNQGKLTNY